MKTYCCYGAYADVGHSGDCVKRGGLFPLPTQKQCRDPGHNAPTHISIPSGYGYRHVCPACGHSVTICPPQATL